MAYMITAEDKFGVIYERKTFYPAELDLMDEQDGHVNLGDYEVNSRTVLVASDQYGRLISVYKEGGTNLVQKTVNVKDPVEIIISETGINIGTIRVPKILREKVRWAYGFTKKEVMSDVKRRRTYTEEPIEVKDFGWATIYRYPTGKVWVHRAYPTVDQAREALAACKDVTKSDFIMSQL